MLLTDIIIQKIKEEGPISFHDFMEMALYYPGLGYYNRSQSKIGKSGDFYTSSSLTPAFGAMIGKQLEQMWDILGKENFTIVEYGAGTGTLCADILNYLRNNDDLYAQLRYCIIEKGAAMREIQRTYLTEKVSWHENISEVHGFTGVVLSNELLDNFSVHQVIMEDKLMEVFVDYQNEFVEILQPAKQELQNYFEELKVDLPKRYRTEINLEAIDWIKEIASCLYKGYAITIDYGDTSEKLYTESKRMGTLLSYNKHAINESFYTNIGDQDITSHVNFSALQHWGTKHGLHTCGLTNQAGFLLRLGFKNYLQRILMLEPQQNMLSLLKKENFISQKLLFEMGLKIQVLIQSKEVADNNLLGLINE
jgi:SAM-dependent MidA family methyltransferase